MRRFLLSLALCLAPVAAEAQFRAAAPLLIIEQERLLSDSLAGQAVLAQEDAARQQLQQEGRELDRAFESEERELTALRETTEPEAFRELADAFDAKVVATRRAQEEKSLQLTQEAEARRRAFFSRVAPILLDLMRETGAAAVIDQRAVLVSNQNLNITDEVIKRLDEGFRGESAREPSTPPGASEDPGAIGAQD